MRYALVNYLRGERWYFKLEILVIALLAMGMSLCIGLQQSVWFDEAYSILVAKQSLSQIIYLAGVDTHPPLYYLVLHVWAGIFGWSEFALRSLSVLAYGASIVVAGALVRKMFSSRAAILAGLFLLFAPLLMRYGFEIRMYSLASLIGISATYVLVCAQQAKGNAQRWLYVLYGVLVAAGMYTLYYLALLWLAHVVWLIATERHSLRRLWRRAWVWAYGLSLILFLPWLPSFLKQTSNGALASIGQPMNAEQLLGVVTFNFLYKPLWQVNVLETLPLVFLVLAGGWFVVRAYQTDRYRNHLLLLICYIAVPIAVLMVVSLFRPMYVERYLSHIAVGFMLLIACSVWIVSSHTKARRVHFMAMTLGVILCAGVLQLISVGNFNYQRMQHPAVNVVTQEITACNSDATVLSADSYVATELDYYVHGSCTKKFYSDQAQLGGGYAPFSQSPDRIGTTRIPVQTKVLYYAYYDSPKLTIDPVYHLSSSTTAGGLTVATYVR